MSETPQLPDFDEVADCFWRLGALQSPSELQAYLLGQLANGNGPGAEQWLQQAAAFIEAVEAPGTEDSRCLLELHAASCAQLQAGQMNLQLLLPDDEVELPLRIAAVGQWCQGFLKGFARAGKAVQQEKGQQQYSADTSEALSDIAAISQVTIDGEEVDPDKNEQDYFEVCEHLRLAVMNIYLDCQQQQQPAPTQENPASPDAASLASPANLFNKKLH